MGDLINLGDLSKPATVLVEKVCNAVGVVYEPTRIRRKARAEADATQILAAGQIEVDALQRRALERLAHQEARKQANIESITAQAATSLPPTANAETLDEDWVAHFFKQCDTVSDSEMQSLWSKLLAGEATAPGTYSRRTVDLVSTLDKSDAALFTALGQFVWMIGEPTPLIYEVDNEIYKAAGISFESLKHLDALGLVSFESLADYQRTGLLKQAYVFYYGRPTMLEFPADAENQMALGHALLTSAGKQLMTICGSQRNDRFYEYVIRRWGEAGVISSSLLPQKASG
jgi:hypothetical protein